MGAVSGSRGIRTRDKLAPVLAGEHRQRGVITVSSAGVRAM